MRLSDDVSVDGVADATKVVENDNKLGDAKAINIAATSNAAVASVVTSGNNITFQAGSDYTYTLSNATAGPGQAQLYVYADQLGAGDNLSFDGSAETTTPIYLTAGAGVDVLKGGQVNDHFVMRSNLTAADSVDGGAGYDWMYLIGNYSGGLSFGATTIKNIESLYFGAGYSYNITLNDANIAAGQQLQIYGKELSLTDTLSVNAAAETNGSLYFDSVTSKNTLTGGAQADTFYIHNGVSHGGVGTLNGGAGNDIFVFDGDVTASNSINGGSGTDSVDLSGFGSRLTLVMTATTITNIETLGVSGGAASITTHDATIAAGARLTIISDTGFTLNGSAEKDGYFTINGSESGDTITTGAMNDIINALGGNDVINGGGGADQMTGGLGNDTYYVDNTADRVIEASGGGTDSILSSVTFSLIGQYVENLTLTGTGSINATGNTLNNTLVGNSGNNTLNGAEGADTMNGGAGNDTYIVDNAGDVVIENTGGGTDTIYSINSYTLGGSFVENLFLMGAGNINATGNGYDNLLVGNDGNNILNGGAGIDTMNGGNGNDTYIVDNANDVVMEGSTGGNDTIYSSINYSLGGRYVESLFLTGAGNINASGNNNANLLVGNDGNNVLNGGAGADTMNGGNGNDTYYVENAGDVVIEGSTGGNDTILSSITWSLSGIYVETLSLQGTANINASGNGNANTLIGNSGNNTLNGGAGNDILTGGGGNDIFVFGAGSGHDTITDFSNDTINLNVLSHGIINGGGISITLSGADTVIDLGGGSVITITGILPTNLLTHILW